ncbi:MAG: toll/interleukin-1 receptor domain-containing protein, partial [Gammaproteobacteria bacterium]|nr:toll/interleukin-1 receptor domain-containing protein [Gammaproteobacteria bacterium]
MPRTPETPRPTVFISYSHDSADHAARVRGLAASLERDGCDCRLDVYKNTGEDWPLWMSRQLRGADFVLCIATPIYERRFDDRELPEIGQGVGWEAGLIRRLLYAKKLHNDHILPVIFEADLTKNIPLELQDYSHFTVADPAGYETLLRKLLDRPLHQRPTAGDAPPLPSQKTDPLFSRPGVSPPPSPATALPRVSGIEQLKTYGDGFAGRRDELAELDAAWDGGHSRVFVLHAQGGAGKTRMLVEWLNRLRDDGWRGTGAVFVHSFYSQGSDERRNASSEVFFEQALRWFGVDAAETITDPDQKARKLTEAIIEQRGLLILDGLEPLQHPPAFNQGRLKDPALARLLFNLANAAGKATALCVITSRQPIVELQPLCRATASPADERGAEWLGASGWLGSSEASPQNNALPNPAPKKHRGRAVVQRELAHLDTPAGVALLRQLEIRGPDEELAKAVEQFGGHAYALMLLGSYLRDATPDREIRRRHEIALLAEDEEHGHHAAHMFRAYEKHLGEDSPEVALLRLLGFFDRAADGALLAVLTGPQNTRKNIASTKGTKSFFRVFSWIKKQVRVDALHAITAPLSKLSSDQWQHCLNRLKALRLITFESGTDPIDAHPLLREWFADELESHFCGAWRDGHRRLYEHLTT